MGALTSVGYLAIRSTGLGEVECVVGELGERHPATCCTRILKNPFDRVAAQVGGGISDVDGHTFANG